MKKTCYGLIVLWMLFLSSTSAVAQVSVGIGLPNLSIGINLPLFPELVPVPGYPVYYAPRVGANYFFYDGMYWVYQNDNWIASSWYNGPWGRVEPEVVPLFVLRVPVRYYQLPPVYFREWQSNAPPRWGQQFGHGWEQRHSGWNRWKRNSVPARAPLPLYQRQYTGDKYPRADQQHALSRRSYAYQPRDKVVRRHFQQQGGPPDSLSQPSRRGGAEFQRPTPEQAAPKQRGPSLPEQRRQSESAQGERQPPRTQKQEQRSHENGESREPRREHVQGQNKEEERSRGRNN